MRGLVLAGGGARGAYQVGALKYLLYELEIPFNVIAGVSVGALNAAVIAQFDVGYEKQAYLALEEIWLNIKEKDVFKRHFPFGILHMPFKGSVYDTMPLKATLKKCISPSRIRGSNRDLVIGATDYESGDFVEFTHQDSSLLEIIRASAAIPILFPYVKVGGNFFMDGGVRELAPVLSAVKRGCTNILTIVPSPKHVFYSKRKNTQPNLKEAIARAVDMSLSELEEKDLLDCPVIRPNHSLTTNALDFDPTLIREMMSKGYVDARAQYDRTSTKRLSPRIQDRIEG